MSARYLIRMDDACHTMDRHKWQLIEQTLNEFGVKPIVAIVPDNQDPTLMVNPPDAGFWEKVRAWQVKGWTIAMHGYTHLMHHTENKLVLPFYKRSEFGGLAYEVQAEKIRQSWKLFLRQGVEPKVWIAPAHCFDLLTLKAIRDETTIRIISDGIACNPYYEHDFFWIPQQLWELSERRSGLWTICLHPNTMLIRDISCLRDMIERQFLNRIVGFNDVNLERTPKSLIDQIYGIYFWQRRRAYQYLDRVRSLCRAT